MALVNRLAPTEADRKRAWLAMRRAITARWLAAEVWLNTDLSLAKREVRISAVVS